MKLSDLGNHKSRYHKQQVFLSDAI